MRKYLADWIRRLANFLDPPSVGVMHVKIDCDTAPFLEAMKKMKKEIHQEISKEMNRSIRA